MIIIKNENIKYLLGTLDKILTFELYNTLIHFDVRNYRVKLILLDIKMESKK